MTAFTVDPAVLSAHAQAVDQVAATVEQAAQAGQQVGYGGNSAYGIIGAPIIGAAVRLWAGDAVSLVASAADLAQAMVDGLQSNADVYEEVENDLRDQLDQLASGIAP